MRSANERNVRKNVVHCWKIWIHVLRCTVQKRMKNTVKTPHESISEVIFYIEYIFDNRI